MRSAKDSAISFEGKSGYVRRRASTNRKGDTYEGKDGRREKGGRGTKKGRYYNTGFEKRVLGVNGERYRYDRDDIIDIGVLSLPSFHCLVSVSIYHSGSIMNAF